MLFKYKALTTFATHGDALSKEIVLKLIALIEFIFREGFREYKQQMKDEAVEEAVKNGDERIEKAWKNMDGSEIDAAFQHPDSRMLKADD